MVDGRQDSGLLVRRGILRWRIRHLNGALSDLRTALKLSPSLPIHHLLALVLLELQQMPAALEAVEHSLVRVGTDPTALALRAIIQADQGNVSEARRFLHIASASANREGDGTMQTSRSSKSVYSPNANKAQDTQLPALGDIPHLIVVSDSVFKLRDGFGH